MIFRKALQRYGLPACQLLKALERFGHRSRANDGKQLQNQLSQPGIPAESITFLASPSDA